MLGLDNSLLSILIFLPLLGALLVAITSKQFAKHAALVVSLVVFLLSLVLWKRFDPASAEYQMMESAEWIKVLGVKYALGVDGISLWLTLLTTGLMPIVILGSYNSVEKREPQFYVFLLALQTGMLGAFFALDAFLFYTFWEVMLIPMYFLIGIWGGKERIFATMKFFVYTMVGSLLMLVAIFYVAFRHFQQTQVLTTSITELMNTTLTSNGYTSEQGLLFLAFSVAFAIKVPLFPLHTWLPDAHVQAPTAGSVILAGVLLKMGGYGFLRLAFPLFPAAVHLYQPIFLALGSIAIVYGALVAMVQPDLKKLVAYSSVSHMGYVILGLFSLNMIGLNGSAYQMLNHGISTPALFLLVGMIYERRHTKEISEFGGLAKVMPLFAIAFMIATLSSVALPGTNGFIGEFLILMGTWQTNRLAGLVAGTGVIFGAVYMLWAYQRVMFGPVVKPENEKLKDLSLREVTVLAPLLVAVFVMGVMPTGILRSMEPSLKKILTRVESANPVHTAQVAIKKE